MIKEIILDPPKRYGSFFLASEAPGDEEAQEEFVPKRNTKVIDIKPNNRKKLNFSDDIDGTLDDEVDDTMDDNGEELDYTDNDDYNQEEQNTDLEQNTETEPNVVDNDNNPDEANQDPNATTGTEPTVNDGDQNNTEISTDTDNPEDPAVDTDTGEDFNSDAGTDDQTQDDTTDQTTDQNTQNGPGLGYDDTRKYNLFLNYVSLANAIKNYITKLEGNLGEDTNANTVIRTSTNKLREIYELCYDFMTMKFELSTYVQSLLFFQNLVVMVQMVFELLSKFNKVITNSNKENKTLN